ncbi:SAM-dependent methyltransferase [Streptomyces coffeae]|uniref:SAM-dependent methyltransferase n=1 Tax=Streptomyces coffeae TaxID=621382 RepID=A0ABS1NHC3_9ACTN|nr:SAM-dependent methyltransferase [Streptomyces coffeae]MBL1099483.1 SAM-dependent methyltransferase [Streptomyces coffeae]
MGEQPAPGQANSQEAELGQNRAHSARMYDYYLGGKTNYAVDREAAEAVIRVFPAIEVTARVNRAFMHRVGRYLARQGVRQFIDLGTGIPTAPNLHEIVQQIAPHSSVLYLDNDPIVLVYADELLDGTPEGTTCYAEADVTRPEKVLEAVEATNTIDLDRPVALSLHALLHFVPDEQDPYEIVRSLLARVAPGSYLSLSHCTGDFDPEAWSAIVDAYTQRGTPTQVRTKAEVLRFFDGLEMVEPGVVVGHRWRPEPASGPSLVTDAQVSLYAGLGRKR